MNQTIQPSPGKFSRRAHVLKSGLGTPEQSHSHNQLSCFEQDSNKTHDTIALVLAGGRGTRLQPLTQRRCKPAVPFGANYRIIDFTLTNCVNSEIRRIGVLTQYEQNSLIRHIQEGWNFLRREFKEFIDILPAQQSNENLWYVGTADAVTQNLGFLKRNRPKHTLILAGDHIYKADYRRLIQNHVNESADVSIACCTVPTSEAHQFGIVDTDDRNRIIKFTEKPSIPVNSKMYSEAVTASMGIYLFNTDRLIECLEHDRHDTQSTHDFGHDIVPRLIVDADSDVVAYQFDQAQSEHYWRDVGTIDAYFEANMQLLDSNPPMKLHSSNWPIHASHKNTFPTHLVTDASGHQCVTFNCIIGSGCLLHGARVRHSILFTGAKINDQSEIENSLILPGAVIGKRCRIRNAIIDSGTRIEDDTEIGFDIGGDTTHYRVSDQGVVVVSDSGDGYLSNLTASTMNPQQLVHM